MVVGLGLSSCKGGHPLAFFSKALSPRSQGLSTYEKEYLAILVAVEQWRSYLQLGEFHIYTDHRSLSQLTEQRLHTSWQQKVFTKLLGLDYKVIYKKGVDNRVADALSRKVDVEAQCSAISVCTPKWLEEVVSSYHSNERAQAMLQKLSIDSSALPGFLLHNGLLRYKRRIWVGSDDKLQHKIMSALHASAVGGHSGVPVTFSRIRRLFAWHGMKSAFCLFVQSCTVCQQAKPYRARLPGLLQPLEVPAAAWQVISMDFVEALPLSSGSNCILVVVDTFSKYAHFLPLKHPFSAEVVAQKFLAEVYRLHGLPLAIVSDRDRIFTSKLWKALFRLC